MEKEVESIKLTQFSHGAGCGCKISPQVLSEILQGGDKEQAFKNLLVGNNSRDDAAVMSINDHQAIISTTDFFTPIVDDPFDFGQIAANNAISDVYAMGGKPLMAIAILGWPVNVLPAEVANQVIAGARAVCKQIGIPLAGGHSIDTPEPIFGLAVTGIINQDQVKQNNTALAGCQLYLTKPLGVGLLTTAEKSGQLRPQDQNLAKNLMLQLNSIGLELADNPGVKAMTDVTGFGLLGHLIEMCEGSDVSANINFEAVPKINGIEYYLDNKTAPGGTFRNFTSYGEQVTSLREDQKLLLCDPQTNGGLLIAVEPSAAASVESLLMKHGLSAKPFGQLVERQSNLITVV